MLVTVLGLNQLLPLAWAEFSRPAFRAASIDDGSICTSGDHGSGTVAVAGSAQPAQHDHGAPHCPLCVLFGGTIWSPPTAQAIAELSIAAVIPAPFTPAATPLGHATHDLRPAPRAPPILV